MLKLSKRRDSPNWYARGTFRGVTVDQSLGTSDRWQAETLLSKLQNEIFERQTNGSARVAEGFAGAALRYMESGRERRFVEPLLRHFGDLPIEQIDQQAIDRAATALYPNGSAGTRNRQVYTPVSAILKFAGVTRDVRRLKARGVVRWLTPQEAKRLIAACSPHLRPLVMFLLYTGVRAGEALFCSHPRSRLCLPWVQLSEWPGRSRRCQTELFQHSARSFQEEQAGGAETDAQPFEEIQLCPRQARHG